MPGRFNQTVSVIKRHGFTLVELLVVVAIISILAGLLLPALENAVSTARTMDCTGNQKNVSLVHQMYFDEYGYYVMAGQGDVYHGTWTAFMEPSGLSAEILKCPEDKQQMGTYITAHTLPTTIAYSSYTWHGNFCASLGRVCPCHSRGLTRPMNFVKNPAGECAMIDGDNHIKAYAYNYYGSDGDPDLNENGWTHIYYQPDNGHTWGWRHMDNTRVVGLFVDGHVAQITSPFPVSAMWASTDGN